MSVHQFNLPFGQEREAAPFRGKRPLRFAGVKCPQTVIHKDRWERDALITLCLDPHVAKIENIDDRAPTGVAFSVGVTLRDGSPVILRFVTDETARKWAQPIPGIAVMSRDAILRSPGLEARRAIWASREATVSATNRYRVASALTDAPDGLSLKHVIGLVEGRSREVVDTVCALACEDVLWIDVTRGLTPEAVVRRTSAPLLGDSKSRIQNGLWRE